MPRQDVTGTGAIGTQPSASAGGEEAADPDFTQIAVTFYFVNPGTTEKVTVKVTYLQDDGSQSAATTASAIFTINGPTGNLLPNAFAQSNETGTSLSNPQGSPAVLSMTRSPLKAGVGVFINDNAQPVANGGQCPPNVGAPPAAGCGQFIWVQILNSVTQSQIIPSANNFLP